MAIAKKAAIVVAIIVIKTQGSDSWSIISISSVPLCVNIELIWFTVAKHEIKRLVTITNHHTLWSGYTKCT